LAGYEDDPAPGEAGQLRQQLADHPAAEDSHTVTGADGGMVGGSQAAGQGLAERAVPDWQIWGQLVGL